MLPPLAAAPALASAWAAASAEALMRGALVSSATTGSLNTSRQTGFSDFFLTVDLAVTWSPTVNLTCVVGRRLAVGGGRLAVGGSDGWLVVLMLAVGGWQLVVLVAGVHRVQRRHFKFTIGTGT